MISNKIFEMEKDFMDFQKQRNTSILNKIQDMASNKQSDVSIFFNYTAKLYEKIRNKDLLKQGIKYFEQMKQDILQNLDHKPSMDEIYGRVSN